MDKRINTYTTYKVKLIKQFNGTQCIYYNRVWYTNATKLTEAKHHVDTTGIWINQSSTINTSNLINYS